MYDRILVPTDGSDVATAAARQAVDLAALAGAALTALYVVDAEAIGFAGPADLDVEEVRTSLRREGEDATNAVAALAGEAGVEAATTVRVGVPDEEILAAVHEADVDLVVMGTHGRSGLDRVLLGSVTERVLRESPVPVLAVPPGDADPVTDAAAAAERARRTAEDEGLEVAGLAIRSLPGADDLGRPPKPGRRWRPRRTR